MSEDESEKARGISEDTSRLFEKMPEIKFASSFHDMQLYEAVHVVSNDLKILERKLETMKPSDTNSNSGEFIDEVRGIKEEYRNAKIKQDRRNEDAIRYLRSRGIDFPKAKV